LFVDLGAAARVFFFAVTRLKTIYVALKATPTPA
jgi:hypothetical protein